MCVCSFIFYFLAGCVMFGTTESTMLAANNVEAAATSRSVDRSVGRLVGLSSYFQMDQHETYCKGWSWATGQLAKNGTWRWEWPATKRCKTSKWIHLTWPNFVNIQTHTFIGHGMPHPYTLTPPPSRTHQLLVVDSCGRHHCRQQFFCNFMIMWCQRRLKLFLAAGGSYCKFALVACIFY